MQLHAERGEPQQRLAAALADLEGADWGLLLAGEAALARQLAALLGPGTLRVDGRLALDRAALAFRCHPDEEYPESVALLDTRFWCLPDDPAAGHPDATVVADLPALAAVLRAQVRAHGEEFPARAWAEGDRVEVRLAERIRGVAPGQSVVLYDGTRVVGSATITASRLERAGHAAAAGR